MFDKLQALRWTTHANYARVNQEDCGAHESLVSAQWQGNMLQFTHNMDD